MLRLVNTVRSPAARLLYGSVYGLLVAANLVLIARIVGQPFEVPYQVLALFSGLLAFMALGGFDLMAPWHIGRRGSVGSRIVLRWSAIVAIVLMFGYGAKFSEYFSRLVLLIWFFSTPIVFWLLHALLRTVIGRFSPELLRGRRAILVFANETTRQFAAELRTSKAYDVLGFFDDRGLDRIGGKIDSVPYLGEAREVAEYVKNNRVDVVFIVLPGQGSRRAVTLFEELGDTTASVYYVPDFEVFAQFEARVLEVENMPVLEIVETPFYGADGLLKQAFDVLFALAVLCVVGLPMILIAIGVKLSSPGPIIFKQKRYGLNGREFWVYKFRTMYVADRSTELRQVSRDDDRVTPIGRILRRTSLDELPQFFNVLKGEMSVVGPRPHTVAHNEYYRREVKRYMSRHKVKPGITGLSQVSGLRGETADLENMEERIRRDLEYIKNWSAWMDVLIIIRTVLLVFRDKNAY